MSPYTLAWVLIVIASLGISALLYRITRGWPAWLRWPLLLLTIVLATVPAPIPQHDGFWAPAFVVLVFEAWFQTQGAPLTSLRVLLFGGALASIIGATIGVLLYRRRATLDAATEQTQQDSDG